MQLDTQQQSDSFMRIFYFLFLGGKAEGFEILNPKSSNVGNTPGVTIMIKSRGKQSRAICSCIKLSKCFCAN